MRFSTVYLRGVVIKDEMTFRKCSKKEEKKEEENLLEVVFKKEVMKSLKNVPLTICGIFKLTLYVCVCVWGGCPMATGGLFVKHNGVSFSCCLVRNEVCKHCDNLQHINCMYVHLKPV